MTAEDLRLLELIVLRARDKCVLPSGSRYTTEHKVLNTLAEQLRDYAKYLEAREERLIKYGDILPYEEPKA